MRSRSTTLDGGALEFLAQDDGFGNFLHRLASLAALFLQRKVRIFLGHAQIALQDPLGALDDFAGLKALGELEIFAFQASTLDFGADQKTDRRHEANFARRVAVRGAALQVDDADQLPATHQRHRQKGLETILRQLVEPLKARVLIGALRDGDRFAMASHPARNAVPHFELQAIHHFGMGIFEARKINSPLSSR